MKKLPVLVDMNGTGSFFSETFYYIKSDCASKMRTRAKMIH